ncbi:hypothetical protein HK100_008332 [Physocladia obscura]|uniref:BZIP domain-containing protein n=1 Tax=Physocladia obscura TaxID=109957 RepID=A0AAD5SP95_9FUNG|nr:hypothetical protein HK100_008332 [Physocladia obscura]
MKVDMEMSHDYNKKFSCKKNINTQSHPDSKSVTDLLMCYAKVMNEMNQTNQSLTDATPTNPVERGWMGQNAAMAAPLNFAALNADAASDWLDWLQGMSAPHSLNVGADLDLGLMLLSLVDVPNPNPRPIKRCSSFGDDAATCKRLRNTEAARKSRVRRAGKIDSLKLEVDSLEYQKSCMTVRIAVLENDAISFAQSEDDFKRRVAVLERQLMDSHHALVEQYVDVRSAL